MKKHTSLLIIILTIINLSCASFFGQVYKKTILPIFAVGASACIANYDAVYYSMDYYLTKHSWPISPEDLSAYAASKNRQISFENYKYFSIEQCSEKRINIHFVLKKIDVLEKPVYEVKGIVGIYIEDEKKINIYSHDEQQIICSFTVSNNPYNDKNFNVTDGYSVHNYIEYYDPDIKQFSDSGSSSNYYIPVSKTRWMNIKK